MSIVLSTFSNLTDALVAKVRKGHLTGLQGHQGERNIWISGYPISGNSYIAYVIAYVLNCKYHDVDRREWSVQRVPLKKFLCGKNSHPQTQAYDYVLKTHAPPSELPVTSNDLVLYVVRDVCDVSNSYFHRVEKSWAASPAFKHRVVSRLSKLLIPLRLRYRLGIRYFSRQWARQVNEVLEKSEIPILKYEQFLKYPLETLEQIIMFIDPASWNAEIAQKALDTFSLKNMKAAAAEAVTDPGYRTDRVGGSGDYQKYFRRSDMEWFDKHYREISKNIDARAKFGNEESFDTMPD